MLEIWIFGIQMPEEIHSQLINLVFPAGCVQPRKL
jgi:hypothetical protein